MRAHTHTRRKCLWQKVLCAPYLRTGPRTTPKKSFRLTSMPNPFISLLIFSVAPCSWNIKSTIFPRKILGFLAPEKSASATRHELHFGHVKCQSQQEEKFNIANCNVRNVRQQSQYQDEFFVQICVRARAQTKANGRRQKVCEKWVKSKVASITHYVYAVWARRISFDFVFEWKAFSF